MQNKFWAWILLAGVFSVQAKAEERPLLSQMIKGQTIKVLADFPIKAGTSNLGLQNENGLYCGFKFKPFVLERVIPAGTVFTLTENARAWENRIGGGDCGPGCVSTSVYVYGTTLTINPLEGFEDLRFECNSRKVDYWNLKEWFANGVEFP